MCDPISLTDDDFQSTCKQAVQNWARLQRQISSTGEAEFPGHAFFVPSLSQGHPTLPRTLDLENDSQGVSAIGHTTWSSIKTCCSSVLPSFRQPLRIRVATQTPTCLRFSCNDADDSPRRSLFEQDENYLPILMLAWTYVLSARWAETMSECCSIAYTQAHSREGCRTNADQKKVQIELLLEHADAPEARWWAAILATGQGWEARMRFQHTTYMSPWSIEYRADCEFVVRHAAGNLPPFCPAASSLDAISYLDKFCIDRDIVDQSHAALAAVLLLPSMGQGRTLDLPGPDIATLEPSRPSTRPTHRARCNIRHDWVYSDYHIDRLLTLSCNVKGVRPMLLSAFYEPSVECNAVAPWLQGTLAAIDHLVGSDPYLTVRLCMERAPKVAFLWLGIFALGLHRSLIEEARFGQIPIDLHSAAWSETIQSFIQQRISVPLVTHGVVSRADECRLLFLAQAESHARLPLCQWQPFGTTPLEDTDIEVRVHQACGDHQLRYEGVVWRCEGNKEIFQPSYYDRTDGLDFRRVTQKSACDNACSIPICSESFNRNREAISENATRMIFGWLRCDGHALHEAGIWKHEWFDVADSDGDEDEDEVVGNESPTSLDLSRRLATQVMTWLSNVRMGGTEF